ncbi:RNAse P Rpr2/Rpp21/SNM1 subunit domain-containing protein [Lipomyces japonicus]|uniref:RNAse P Rpr2/Rpp21/SNM1 subunit domain-containing protein n=1 Tax=Lipomyces japonicus TaxID=56871 RepID=UPI0034CFB8B2
MVKKKTPPTNAELARSLKNRDQYLRSSFLYKAAVLMSNTSNQSDTVPLSRLYLSQMRTITKKNVIRMDPNVKRSICKRCDSLLSPGTTSHVKVENLSASQSPACDVLTSTCRFCGGQKRFPVGNRAYQVFTEKPENIVHSEK